MKALKKRNHSISIDEERYFLAAVVDSSKDSIVTINFDSIITSWNRAAEYLYGYPAHEAIGRSLSLVVLPKDISQLFVNIERIKHSQEVEVYDTIRIQKGGESIHLQITLSPVKDDDGQVIGVSTIARDVTERIKVQEALRRSEEEFRALVSQSSVGIYHASLNRKIILANDKMCQILGYTKEELIGQEIWSHTAEEDLETEKNLFENFRQAGSAFEHEKRIITKDGKVRWINESVSPIYDSEGHLESIMGVAIDITEKKETERHKDDFIGIASHELKTPLTSIQAYGEILQGKLESGDYSGSLDVTKRLNKQIGRFRKLVLGLLDTGKITAGVLKLDKTHFDFDRFVADVIGELREVAGTHELKVVSTVATLICADQERIRQVLTNLISNAIKYSPGGGRVIIDCKELDDSIHVSVMDEGIGVPEEFHSKVFDRFFRVETKEARSVAGIGLGLYISSEIIKKHGGTIGVRNNESKGATFYFTLPLWQRSA